MKDNKTQELVNKLEQYRESLFENKKASKAFLVKAGILTQRGDLKANYKHLCIPPGRV